MTPKQEAFVREYLIDLNATQAAIRSGYSARTAEKIGSENVRKPVIAAAIEVAIQERAARTLVTADKVLLSLQRIANKAESLGELPAATRAWELIGKHYKLFTDRLEVKDMTPRAERLHAARKRRELADK